VSCPGGWGHARRFRPCDIERPIENLAQAKRNLGLVGPHSASTRAGREAARGLLFLKLRLGRFIAKGFTNRASKGFACVTDLIEDDLKRCEARDDEVACGLVEARNCLWIALRGRNGRPADMIGCPSILVAGEECHGANRVLGFPTIRIASFSANATQKCADGRRRDGVVELRVHFVFSPWCFFLQSPRAAMRCSASDHEFVFARNLHGLCGDAARRAISIFAYQRERWAALSVEVQDIRPGLTLDILVIKCS
jgi:hypothetical protein